MVNLKSRFLCPTIPDSDLAGLVLIQGPVFLTGTSDDADPDNL